ncbi:hypothetical protein [Geothrix sp. 21YS21S-2]|uniref:hypothetical protein n=1 Tax=Geothrix sp. 21YS21S-2 TaxID=3068893 RepID=UPI0027B9AC56|nr:hypothetical protein [Geothrix sp. 21YS21S-2]
MFRRAGILVAFGLATTASAGGFGPLMETARGTWPEKTRISVVANYRRSAAEIQSLAEAAGEGCTIVVLDVRDGRADYGRVLYQETRKIMPDYLVLLRDDPCYPEGVLDSTVLVRQMVKAGIPCLGTTPAAIRQGATFAVGPETGNQVLVNPEARGTINVTLPGGKVSSLGRARIVLMAMK